MDLSLTPVFYTRVRSNGGVDTYIYIIAMCSVGCVNNENVPTCANNGMLLGHLVVCFSLCSANNTCHSS